MVKGSQIFFLAGQQILNFEKSHKKALVSLQLGKSNLAGTLAWRWCPKPGLTSSSAIYQPWTSGQRISLTWTQVFSFSKGQWWQQLLLNHCSVSQQEFISTWAAASFFCRNSSFKALGSGPSDNSWIHSLFADARLAASGHLARAACHEGLRKHSSEESVTIQVRRWAAPVQRGMRDMKRWWEGGWWEVGRNRKGVFFYI